MAFILLVDDDTALLDVLSMAFTDAGHTVATAAQGLLALEQIKRQPPDVLVSDVNMPVLDGFALCQVIRRDKSRLPIILLTSRE